ncbi:protein WEAK CHLOROPLAST MOVEMENT UNDER BLUE LIGHT-like 3 [Curcuma longa]|uniref:protein WEAK CHLOROPLAST MOVEMENT UNDER BLUE LIGHT-like 3 n=1 Tax=Curcuma longa TaxID=136217 RepID=UPI003D9E3203
MEAARGAFERWQVVSNDKGRRVVHHYLNGAGGGADLAVVGREKSSRHVSYVVPNQFVRSLLNRPYLLPSSPSSSSSSSPQSPPAALLFKWRSRREDMTGYHLSSQMSMSGLTGAYSCGSFVLPKSPFQCSYDSLEPEHNLFAKMLETEANPHMVVNEIYKSALSNREDVSSCETTRSRNFHKDEMIQGHGHIDTAAPFESVKAAINKFGGVVHREAQTIPDAERQKAIQLEFEKVQEEILEHRKEYEAVEEIKARVVKKLDDAKRYIEELKLELEKAESSERKAKEEAEIADTRLRRQIASCSSVANMAKMEVAKELIDADLASAKEELELMMRAKRLVSESNEMEVRTKEELLELAQSANLEVEEQMDEAASDFQIEQDKLNWEKELKRVENELQQLNEQLLQTNELESRLDKVSAALSEKKAELASFKALQEARVDIEEASKRVINLKATAFSLSSELETEKRFLESLREKEGLAIVSVSSLEAELEAMKTKLGQVMAHDSSDRVTLSIEEYFKLSQKANEAEEMARRRTISAIEQLKEAKDSKARRLEELEEANRKILRQKKTLNAILEEIEKTNEAKLNVEQELRRPRGHERMATSGVARSLSTVSDPGVLLDQEFHVVEADRASTIRSNNFNAAGCERKRSKSLLLKIANFWG